MLLCYSFELELLGDKNSKLFNLIFFILWIYLFSMSIEGALLGVL